MFRFSKQFLQIAIILVFAGSFDAAAQANVLSETLRRMDAHNKTLTSLRANVSMAKMNAQLGDTDVTSGTAIYGKRKGKDALVRVDWVNPSESLAVVDGAYVIYRPRLKQAYVGSVKTATSQNARGTNSALAFMNMTREQLRANYDAVYLGEGTLSDGTRTVHIKLTPKARTSYKTAELWVDVDGMPRQSKLTEHNNDTTTVLLTNIQKNPSLKGSDFEIKLPPGTKTIKS
jgi:outer membrane lipoprotein-sorting protein